jgi:WD40 repeat protein
LTEAGRAPTLRDVKRLLLLLLLVGCATERAIEPRPGPARRLTVVAFAHPRDVTALTYAPGGARLVTGCEDGVVRFFDPETGALESAIVCSGVSVTQLTFSGDGARLLARDAVGVYRLFRCDTGALLLERALPDPALAAAPSPDLREVASVTRDWDVVVTELATGRVLWRQSPDGIHSLAYSPDGTHLAASSPGRLQVFDRVRGVPILESRWETGSSTFESALAFSPAGDLVAVGDHRGAAIIEVPGRKRLQDLGVPRETVRTLFPDVDEPRLLAFSPDGRSLAAVTGCEVSGHDLLGEKTSFDWPCEGAGPGSFSPDGRVFAVARGKGIGFLAPGKGLAGPRLGHRQPVTALALSPDGSRLATGTRDGSVLAWDLARPVAPTVLASEGEPVLWVGFSSNGEVVGIQRPKSAALIGVTGQPIQVGEPMLSVGFSLDGRCAWRGQDYQVHLLESETTAPARERPIIMAPPDERGTEEAGGVAPGTSVALDKDSLVWSGRADGVTRMRIEGADGRTARALSPDGTKVAFGGRGWLHVHDAVTGARIADLDGYPGTGSLLAFSGDGHRLAATTNDGAILVWDLPPNR